ncbi:unnamed protein product [Eruca vesicaria subsp. sativa]|uniref:Uncharacterized protein n=1 Tax=Eruca vesicaria subsp. sativa TaxID=29727 RepID=A0ABC8J6M5_ERUVS|nr:unnamed protein product [Eruca vesicaria subsp. sativa]
MANDQKTEKDVSADSTTSLLSEKGRTKKLSPRIKKVRTQKKLSLLLSMKTKKAVTAMISKSKEGHESANSYLTEEERVMKEQSEFMGIYSSTI